VTEQHNDIRQYTAFIHFRLNSALVHSPVSLLGYSYRTAENTLFVKCHIVEF
jgi:hypothetical protein